MDALLRLGYGAGSLQFDPNKQASIQSHFGDTDASGHRLVGRDGGSYKWGYGRAPSTQGNLQAYIWEFASSPAEMQAIRDKYYRLLNNPPMQIVKLRMDGRQVWTWAVCTNIQASQTARNVPHRSQQFQLNFYAPTARWYGRAGADLQDADSILEDGLPAIAPQVDRLDVGNGDTVQVTNYGTAESSVYIRWEAPEGVTVTDPTLSRDNATGQGINSIQYNATLTPGDVVDIDTRNHVFYETNTIVTGSYDKVFDPYGQGLIIPPGTHTLEIAGEFTGGDAKLTIDYWDVYY